MPKPKLSPSFDAMIKFFLQHANFATKQDFNKLIDKIDVLEKHIRKLSENKNQPKTHSITKNKLQEKGESASGIVLNIIKENKAGISFADIKSKTNFEEKKLRNIIYRLGKLKKITHKERGLYRVI